MLFNSLEFAIFLPLVFIGYWFIAHRSIKSRNVLLLIASYIFYGWWDWRFLSLIIFSSALDYTLGLCIANYKDNKKRKLFLWISLLANLGLLGVFKYYNFFTDSLLQINPGLESVLGSLTLDVVLPVGISFYTFQTLSYTIDIYKNKIEPTTDIIAFFSFVSFFPQLVAGPIERAQHLLPQFLSKREFNYGKAVDGLRQILWGLFKKVVIADNCAIYVNDIFANYSHYSGSTLLLGAFFFAFQIYGDFSGYSDIAIGTARLFGFDLMKNFAFPYFSRDIAEFWRRWHISLSTWFRDYLYIPLGGSRGGLWKKIRNIFIIFIVSGLWHGANWTFIVWGALNAIYFLPLMLLDKNRDHTDNIAGNKLIPSFKNVAQILSTFFLTLIGWVFFRAKNVSVGFDYIINMTSASLFTIPEFTPGTLMLLIFIFTSAEWVQRNKEHGLDLTNNKLPRYAKWSIYLLILAVISMYGGSQQEFIYFQF